MTIGRLLGVSLVLLFAAGCMPGYIKSKDLEAKGQGPTSCAKACEDIGMRMTAMVLVGDTVPGCVCQTLATAPAASANGAPATPGAGPANAPAAPAEVPPAPAPGGAPTSGQQPPSSAPVAGSAEQGAAASTGGFVVIAAAAAARQQQQEQQRMQQQQQK